MVVHYQILAVVSAFTCLSLWMHYRQVYRTNYVNETPAEAQLQQVQNIIVAVKNALFPTERSSEVPEELVE